jgi:hypothetical protein
MKLDTASKVNVVNFSRKFFRNEVPKLSALSVIKAASRNAARAGIGNSRGRSDALVKQIPKTALGYPKNFGDHSGISLKNIGD